ncbi:diguanylate cyclase [Halobacteriales archaeon SW_7_68_16]|nr:MAG: diguanylate cyclase [Halobacteriales archaeon SW_7_68_16]
MREGPPDEALDRPTGGRAEGGRLRPGVFISGRRTTGVVSTDDAVRVLCVDDGPGVAGLVAARLSRADPEMETEAVTSASEGIARVAAGGIDSVVSGYDMPAIDGIAFLELLRATDPDLPFVLFSGRAEEGPVSDALSAGATDYLPRQSDPGQYDVLARRVRSAVERLRSSARPGSTGVSAAVLETAPDAVVVYDEETVYANRAAVTLFGGEGAEPDSPAVDDAVATLLDGIEPATDDGIAYVRRSMTDAGGRSFPATIITRTIDWDGRPASLTVIRDLSGRDRNESDGERYRIAFEESTDALVVVDGDTCLDANGSATQLFGLSRPELVGSDLTAFVPEDADVATPWREFATAREGMKSMEICRDGGGRRRVEASATSLPDSGNFVWVIRDVTDYVATEAELRHDWAALHDIYRIAADQEAGFEPKIEQLLKRTREYLGLPVGFLTCIDGEQQFVEIASGEEDVIGTGDTCPLSEAYCRKTIRYEEPLTVQDASVEGWEGDPAYERFGLGSYVGAKVIVDGKLHGTLCFAAHEPRDEAFSAAEETLVGLLARWVGYELDRNRVTEQLRQQNNRLDEFASLVSHDLRNPLTTAQGYVEFATEGDEADIDEALGVIDTALQRMERLIDDLLYLAREGIGIDSTEEVAIADVVRTAWSVTGAETEADLTVADDLGTIVADRDRLRQLIENLLRNAIEHGGPSVAVAVERTPGGFAISDDGPGVPVEERDNIFDRGYSTRDAGTGFGLTIVGRIAESHGWTVSVSGSESESGGARFEIDGARHVED